MFKIQIQFETLWIYIIAIWPILCPVAILETNEAECFFTCATIILPFLGGELGNPPSVKTCDAPDFSIVYLHGGIKWCSPLWYQADRSSTAVNLMCHTYWRRFWAIWMTSRLVSRLYCCAKCNRSWFYEAPNGPAHEQGRFEGYHVSIGTGLCTPDQILNGHFCAV